MKRSLLLSFSCLMLSFCLYGQQSLNGINARQMVQDSSWQLRPGVLRRDLRYLDSSGKIVSVKVIRAKLKKNKLVLEAATPDNKDQFGRQTVPREMKMEDQPDHEVIAGINADFFNMKNGTPLGPVVKEGRIIKGGDSHMNCFVGVLNSGKILMGDAVAFQKNKKRLTEALGARPRLLRDGKLLPQDSSNLSRVHHPRSAFGLIGKKTILLVTVDGRQPAISNGISLTDLAKLMQWLGADNAVNLDGGGSTTLVVKQSEANRYEVQNSPSGKMLRPVANSWILVKE